jgi:uncharacterized protein YdeI (YjbR/CyaY-like superfamily)
VVELMLEKDHSEYGMPVPEELIEFWEQDPEGAEHFHALTKGRQRSLIHWVNTVKSSNKRIQRSYVMMEHLKRNGGVLDFRAMLDLLKEENRRQSF